MTLKIEHFVLGELSTNCYLVHDDSEALLIDPAIPSGEIKEKIERENLNLQYIINTHGHIDHIGGNVFFKEHFPQARLVIGERDLVYLTNPDLNLSRDFSSPFVSPLPDWVVRESNLYLDTPWERLSFLLSPGHTPGSVCLFFPVENWLFSGDTLFAGSVGRTDLPGGSFRDLISSLEEIFNHFPDSTSVFPGHGPLTNLAREKKENFYYLQYLARD